MAQNKRNGLVETNTSITNRININYHRISTFPLPIKRSSTDLYKQEKKRKWSVNQQENSIAKYRQYF